MVTVDLSADPERTVAIPITKSEQGGATTADYSAPADVTFNSGDTEKTITFSATADTLDDDDESVKLAFGTLPAGVREGSPKDTTVSITDDDDPAVTVSFGVATYTATEGDTATVTVTLSADPEREVIIPLTKSEQGGASTADYSGVPATVTFNAGDTEKTFTFSATQDTEDDDDESVKLGFGSTLPARVSAGTTDETTVSITDDDGAGVTVNPASLEIDEGMTGTYTVVLDTQPSHSVTVTPSIASGDGFTISATTLTFTTLNWDTAQTVTVTGTDDADALDDTGVISHSMTSTDSNYSVTGPSVSVKVIDDEDIPVIVTFEAESYEVAEGGSGTVKVLLDPDPDRRVIIQIIKTNLGGASNSDYSVVPAHVTFNAGDTEKTITFMATQDTADDQESVKLGFGTLAARVSAGSPKETTVSITDDDDPQVTVWFGASVYTAAEGDTATVTVTLSADPEREVIIPLTKSEQGGATSADYSGVPADVTFNSGDTYQTFTFSATADSLEDDDESVKLAFGTLPAGVIAGSPAQATLTITRDGSALSNRPPAFTEGASTTRSVSENTAAGASIGLPVRATDPNGDRLTYSLSGTDAASFGIVASSGQLQTRSALNYETKNSYALTMSVRDGKDTLGNADSRTDDTIRVSINVTDVNEVPVRTVRRSRGGGGGFVPSQPPAFITGARTPITITGNLPSGANVGRPVAAPGRHQLRADLLPGRPRRRILHHRRIQRADQGGPRAHTGLRGR